MALGDEIKVEFNAVCGVDNQQAEYGDFATSYLPWHDKGLGPDSQDGETALIKDGNFYILNGNWMLTYSELAEQGGFDACYAFFCRKYPQFGSSWSEAPN